MAIALPIYIRSGKFISDLDYHSVITTVSTLFKIFLKYNFLIFRILSMVALIKKAGFPISNLKFKPGGEKKSGGRWPIENGSQVE